MDPKQRVTISKFLSRHLRHEPESLGLQLEPGGWVRVADLLAACQCKGYPLTSAQLSEVVVTSDKQRFSFDETGSRIRANQGHSTAVDLQLEALTPPELLFHGTGHRNVESILASGLQKMARHHVHLSANRLTAINVGRRHGRPVVFIIDCVAMAAAGFAFYRSANGVWLTEHVPARYLRLDDET